MTPTGSEIVYKNPAAKINVQGSSLFMPVPAVMATMSI